MEDLILGGCLGLAFILWIIKIIFSKKIEKYENYIQYIITKLIEKADDEFDEMDKQGKHSYVAKEVYKLAPTWIKVFISEEKIDNWIHQYVHKLRQKQKEVVDLTTKVVIGNDGNSNINSDKLKSLINESKKSTKISVEPLINIEDFKKSKIGIKFESLF